MDSVHGRKRSAREECSYGCWTDFDPEKRGLRVTEKKDFPKFKIKDDKRNHSHQRRISRHPDSKAKALSKSRLILPTAEGEPDGHKLRLLKKLAFRAGLNCGHCQARDEYTGKLKSCREHPVCDKWTLHDFRRTYATMLDVPGTPIDDIRINLGHADIETTRGYIKARNTRDPKIWKAVNKALPGLLAIVKAKS